MDRNISLIIAAAGSGHRMDLNTKKQYLMLMDKPIIQHTIEKFYKIEQIKKIIVISDRDNIDFVRKEIIEKENMNAKAIAVTGGSTRTASVYNGLMSLDPDTEYVLIHDGVRPFVSTSVILKAIQMCIEKKAVVVCSKTVDTIKIARNNEVIQTLDRKVLWNAETPQCFKFDLLMSCMEKALRTESSFTDESSILEYFGHKVYVCENKEINIKITDYKDLEYAEYLVKKRGRL
ncbi:MAG: 2-C-methyl-D-erythritol 4-phosphate cytidylyltransferase [Clostridiales bacterium 38_11]|nr:MAG: 2-C-methyl-D-erythritol 4-phosphate cytidylyltransferase [Clostridiales bacterium 38_11]HBH13401.1 2-C-methyl-D-erythritol 4-phosphate cytidylyltransferase [Clostridiales bacterium]